jgi:hypothetical protein
VENHLVPNELTTTLAIMPIRFSTKKATTAQTEVDQSRSPAGRAAINPFPN